MNDYELVINKAKFALNNGEYKNCINLLNPLLEEFPLATKKGVNIRMLLITALSGINRKEEAIKICKQLVKSNNTNVREEAKSLLQILNSPDLKIPDEWNIKFENSFKGDTYKSTNRKNISTNKPHKYINISKLPTGETKSFQKGFLIFTLILLILIISLLSGCVKVENDLDLREINSINYDLRIESKYLNKMPWQLNFENKLKELSLSKNININDENFELRKKGLDIKETNEFINKILKIASKEIEMDLKDIKIDQFEKNFIFGKKHFYYIKLDLLNLQDFNNLEIVINIINPSKVKLSKDYPNINSINKNILWEISPGDINEIEFSFWKWNRFLICITIVILLIILAYYIRNKKYEIGTKLPQLPS